MPQRPYSRLKAIQESTQKVAEAISSSIGLETEIVDQHLEIIAGTGKYRSMIGLFEEGKDVGSFYLYGRVISSGRPEIVENAQTDLSYDPLVPSGTVSELAEVCCPIKVDNEVIGVIGLVAFDQNQQQLLSRRKRHLLDFLQWMAELLASKAIESETVNHLRLVSKRL